MAERSHDYVVRQLKAHRANWREIAAATGVPLRSIEKIGRETWKNPGVRHIDTLAAYFRNR